MKNATWFIIAHLCLPAFGAGVGATLLAGSPSNFWLLLYTLSYVFLTAYQAKKAAGLLREFPAGK